MIKVLAIGNSFSEDATHFLHQIGEAAGVGNKVVNLSFIPRIEHMPFEDTDIEIIKTIQELVEE